MTVLARIRRLTLRESLERGRQACAKWRERAGLDPGVRAYRSDPLRYALDRSHEASVEALLSSFVSSERPGRLFAGLGAPGKTLALASRQRPQMADELLDRARRAERGEFDLLGLKGLEFGKPIAWSLEPVSGKSTPRTHWSRIDFLDPEVAGDKKVTWELSRHRHLVDLAKLALLTGSVRHAREAVEQLESWIRDNPPKLGIHWASSLESAYRAIAWCWALSLLRGTEALTPGIFARATACLDMFARHIQTYLSTYFSPNTHLTGEALGLLYIGAFFPGLQDSTGYVDQGWSILEREAPRQILDDGVYFERTTYYHRYTVDIYIHALLIGRALGRSTAVIEDRLRRALRHLMHMVMPGGTTPLIGDDDGGRLLFLDQREPDDFRSPLATGAFLLGDPEMLHVAGDLSEETYWLLGAEVADRATDMTRARPGRTAAVFPDGGLVVVRDGWDDTANAIVFDAGEHGALACGHSHADALAFALYGQGVRWLIDSGTYTYTLTPSERNAFRGTAAHNSVVVDGRDSSEPGAAFKWRSRARACLEAGAVHERAAWFAGTHDGYERLETPVSHLRGILSVFGEYWLIVDDLRSAGSHAYEVLFQFDPECQVTAASGRFEALHTRRGLALDICTAGPPGQIEARTAFASFCYGAREEHAVGAFRFEGDGRKTVMSWIRPRPSDERPASMRRRQAAAGQWIELESGERRDLFGWNDGEGLRDRGCRVTADAAAFWARIDRDGVPRRWMALDAVEVRIDDVVSWSGERCPLVAGRRQDGRWSISRGSPIDRGPGV